MYPSLPLPLPNGVEERRSGHIVCQGWQADAVVDRLVKHGTCSGLMSPKPPRLGLGESSCRRRIPCQSTNGTFFF